MRDLHNAANVIGQFGDMIINLDDHVTELAAKWKAVVDSLLAVRA